ncbi:hypothetical protein C6366_02690 [Desulfonatronum sp. SC1]|nr:hypothetical protein C6366_02690 [Desulfonatronum sp. SC1]
MLDTADERTKIFFVCNPNNPTGTYWDAATMRGFLDAVGNQRIVVLDEAYFEYVDREDYPDGMELMREYPNLVVFRTFSKMYALAGLRVGYLCGSPEVVDIIRRTHVVYSVNIRLTWCSPFWQRQAKLGLCQIPWSNLVVPFAI